MPFCFRSPFTGYFLYHKGATYLLTSKILRLFFIFVQRKEKSLAVRALQGVSCEGKFAKLCEFGKVNDGLVP